MKYILSQEEFDKLTGELEVKLRLKTEKLQKLCTQIADEMPIKWTWGPGKESPRPWGCIHSEGGENWHCDECPVTSICPSPKSWSQ